MTRTTLALSFFLALGLALAAGRAEAQATTSCPPGQSCVVVVPQTQPQISGTVTIQPVQPTPPPGYVVQPQPQPVYAQPVYAAPPRQAVQETRTRLRWGLIGPGIGLVVGGWVGNWVTGLAGIFAVNSYDVGDYLGWSWIPFVGPWVNAGYFAGTSYDGLLGFHVLWGILQAGGLLMCILGTVFQEEVVETRYVQADGPTFAVLPWADQYGGGLALNVAGF